MKFAKGPGIPLVAGLLTLLLTSGALAQGSKRVVFNHFISDPKQTSVIYITDAQGMNSDVEVNFYTNAGEIIGQKKLQVPANGTVAIKPVDVVKRVENGKAIVISKGGRIIGEYWQLVETDDFKYSVAVPGQSAVGKDVLFVQHLVSDPQVTSVIFVSDTREKGSVPVDIEFLDEGGGLMGKTSNVIPSGGTLVLKPHDVLKKKTVGGARITTRGGPIVGEYWQFVSGKFKNAETGKEEKINYCVAVPMLGRVNTTLNIIDWPDRMELVIPVHFDVDKDEVRDVDKPNLAEGAKMIDRFFFGGETIVIEGHTDQSGDADYNMKLSMRRAESVARYLTATHGISAAQLQPVGKGEEEPIIPGATGAAGEVNRRVVFLIPK